MERVYVLEVDRRPLLAFPAASQHEARQLPKEAWLIDDLSLLRSKGEPLWAESAAMTVRPATANEQVVFENKQSETAKTDELLLVYLIELDS